MGSFPTTESNAGGEFLWPLGLSLEDYEVYRVSGDDSDFRRDPEDLPTIEIVNATVAVPREQISLPFDDLVRVVARRFGFQSTGLKIRERIELGVMQLIATDRAGIEDGRVSLA